MFYAKTFLEKRGDRKKRLLTKLKKIINGASITKIKFVVIPLVDNGKIRNEKQKKTLINELKKIENFLKNKKVQLLFETDFPPKRI